jgi:uncharacterized protein (TIGR03118 family)
MTARRHAALIFLGAIWGLLPAGNCPAGIVFKQTNLVSSVPGMAPTTDANLKNPWGIALSPTSPFWVSNQGSSNATLYNGVGQQFPIGNPLVVTIPSGPSGGPTGQVFNTTSSFSLGAGQKALFIFANIDGSISAWNPSISPTLALLERLPDPGNSYTGLAIGTTGGSDFLYAANHASGKIDVFDSAFTETSLGGGFTDPGLGAGFLPNNIQNFGGTVYVTYSNEISGGGVLDAFDQNGVFLHRLTANGAGGTLDSPWGLALAPPTFGEFSGALLVGNHGDGRISAFDPLTGSFLGQLKDSHGNFISIPGLWGLAFGNGGNGGDPNALYFTAGLNAGAGGLFGRLSVVPEPSSVVLLGLGLVSACGVAFRKRARPT